MSFAADDGVPEGPGGDFVPISLVNSTEVTRDITINLRIEVTLGDTLFAGSGQSVQMPLNLNNPTGNSVGELQLRVASDAGNQISFSNFVKEGALAGFTASISTQDDTAAVGLETADASVIAPGNRKVGELTIGVDDETPLGFHSISMLNLVISDSASAQQLPQKSVDGILRVGRLGDVNEDNKVSVLDLIKVVYLVIARNPFPPASSFAFFLADVNGDESIDITDVILQVNLILGIVPGKQVAQSPTQPVTARLDSPQIVAENKLVVPMILDIEGVVVGFQATFMFDPNAILIEKPTVVEPSEDLRIDSHISDDGTVRLVVFSMTPGVGFPAGNLARLYIPVIEIKNGTGGTTVTLNDLILVEAHAQSVPVNIAGRLVEVSIPSAFDLVNNHPNPFNPSTSISYDVPQQAHITLVVYNVLGQKVVRLVDEFKQPGRYIAIWQGRNLNGIGVSSGVYFYRLSTSTGFVKSKRMTLLKKAYDEFGERVIA